jgi:hypothetical protein
MTNRLVDGRPPPRQGSGAALAWMAAAFVFLLVSLVAAVATQFAHGRAQVGWAVVQVVAAALAWLIPQVRQVLSERGRASAEQREFEARVTMAVAMNDALDPVMTLLGKLAGETDRLEREKLRAQAVPLVLATASQLIGPERTRACWFELETGPPLRLVPVEAAGRAGSPTTVFEHGTPAGDAAIGMVLEDEDRICEDVAVDPPPGWDPARQRDYRTFVAVAVIAGDVAFGMLTLDAPEPGDLTREDMRLLRLMAGALAVALGQR